MAEQTIDEILADAKRFLAKRTVADEARDFAEAQRTSGEIVRRGPDVTYGGVAKDALSAAALPAAFLSGPVGGTAAAYFALDALKNAAKNPSAMNVGMAGLSAIPAVRPLRQAGGLLSRLFKGGAKEAESLLTAEQMAASAGH